MPAKIITDQPQAVRKTLQAELSSSPTALAEPPYFSIPLTDEDVAIIDPADADRELRAGEVFFATGLQIANASDETRTVTVRLVSESGVTTSLAPGLIVPAGEVLTLLPGLSMFKRDLAYPGADGMTLVAFSDQAGALTFTATVVEREALEHAPDTE